MVTVTVILIITISSCICIIVGVRAGVRYRVRRGCSPTSGKSFFSVNRQIFRVAPSSPQWKINIFFLYLLNDMGCICHFCCRRRVSSSSTAFLLFYGMCCCRRNKRWSRGQSQSQATGTIEKLTLIDWWINPSGKLDPQLFTGIH